MTEEEKQNLKKAITAEIVAVKESIPALEESAKPVAPDEAIGRLTRMEAINNQQINAAALRAAKAKLSKLERALSKIDSEDFGLCAVCEEPIPIARLMHVPESSCCVKCAR